MIIISIILQQKIHLHYFYTQKLGNDVELKTQKFESKDKDYCISLLESIMNLEDFLGWPFGNKLN